MDDPLEILDAEVDGRGGALAVLDFDADGDLDLVTGQVSGRTDVYANDGAANFTVVEGAVPTVPGVPLAVAAADLDGDDLPELFYPASGDVYLARNLGGLQWAEPVRLTPTGAAPGQSGALTVALGDVDGDADLDLVMPNIGGEPDEGTIGLPDLVLENPGDGSTPWSVLHELVSAGTGSITQVATFTDRDFDGDQDLFIPNDRGPPSAFWRNDGDGTLVNDAADISADLDMAAMGIDNWDLNSDGVLDYCMSDTGPPLCLVSDGSGGYFEAAAALGLYPAEPAAAFPATVGWAFDFADFNGDGRVDAVQASGPDPGATELGVTELPDLLWAGTEEGRFEDVSAIAGVDNPEYDYGLAAADFDGDGYPDLVVAGPDRPPFLFVNSCGAGAWLELDLVGPAPNRAGYGARAFVEIGDGRTLTKELMNLRGQGQGPARIHFGLGDVDVVAKLTVVWPDGGLSQATNVPTRRRITIDHAEATGGSYVPPEGDDDDTFGDDDDDVLIPGEGEIVVEGIAFEPGSRPGESQGLEGLTVFASHDPDTERTTDSLGIYRIIVPEEGAVDLTVTGPGLVPSVCPIDPSWQTSAQEGLFHAIYDATSFDGFVQTLFGTTPADGAAMVWVQVGAGGGNVLAGAVVELSCGYESAWAFGEGQPQPGNTVLEGANFVGFANVPAGPCSIEIETPAGESCFGRDELEIVGDSLVQVVFRCQ